MTNKGQFDDAELSEAAKKYMKMLRLYENQNSDESDSAANGHH